LKEAAVLAGEPFPVEVARMKIQMFDRSALWATLVPVVLLVTSIGGAASGRTVRRGQEGPVDYEDIVTRYLRAAYVQLRESRNPEGTAMPAIRHREARRQQADLGNTLEQACGDDSERPAVLRAIEAVGEYLRQNRRLPEPNRQGQEPDDESPKLQEDEVKHLEGELESLRKVCL
jgi:hypothetical protein